MGLAMKSIGAFEAKTHFSALIEEVERGAQISITKHGRLVAKLVPAQSPDRQKKRQTIDRLKAFCRQNRLDGIDWRILRDEGRR
jgi:prevent-host-death family protein